MMRATVFAVASLLLANSAHAQVQPPPVQTTDVGAAQAIAQNRIAKAFKRYYAEKGITLESLVESGVVKVILGDPDSANIYMGSADLDAMIDEQASELIFEVEVKRRRKINGSTSVNESASTTYSANTNFGEDGGYTDLGGYVSDGNVNKAIQRWYGWDIYLDNANSNRLAAGAAGAGVLALLIPDPTLSKAICVGAGALSASAWYANAEGKGIKIKIVYGPWGPMIVWISGQEP